MADEKKTTIDEIIENVRKDRQRLELVADDLVQVLRNPPENGTQVDPLARVGMAENLSRVTEALTRSNALLVELAKMKSKENIAKKMTKGSGFSFDEDEREELMAEIQDRAQ